MKTKNLDGAASSADDTKVHRGLALLFFITPITAVMAGAVLISGITPHVVTSALFVIVAGVSILAPHRKLTALTTTVLSIVIAMCVVTILHLAAVGVPISNEVTISLSGLAILLGVASVRANSRTFNVFIVGWTFAYLLAGAAAIMERFLGYVAPNNYLLSVGYDVETVGVASFFGNPNGFGFFLVATGAVFMPFVLTAKNMKVRALYFALQLSTLYFMLETYSRTGFTLLAIIILLTLWKLLYKRDLLRFLVILGVLIVVIVQLLSPGGVGFFNDLRDNTFFSTAEDDSFIVRFNLILNGLLFLGENPLIGIGPGMYEVNMQTQRDLYPAGDMINPHNGFIEILSQYGLVVFALYVIWLFRSFVSARNLMRLAETNRERNYVLGLTQVVLIALLPFTATMHSTFLGAPAAWLYLCAIVVLGRMATSSAAEVDNPRPVGPGRRSLEARAYRRYVS